MTKWEKPFWEGYIDYMYCVTPTVQHSGKGKTKETVSLVFARGWGGRLMNKGRAERILGQWNYSVELVIPNILISVRLTNGRWVIIVYLLILKEPDKYRKLKWKPCTLAIRVSKLSLKCESL